VVERSAIGIGHLQVYLNNLMKAYAILNQGKGILPFVTWQDQLDILIEEVEEYIKEEDKL
jgi:hypothetical protein